MDKAKIREFAVWARERLIAEITYKAGLLGITEKGIAPELPASTGDLKLYDIGTKTPARVEGSVAIAQRQSLASAINKKADTLKYKDAFEYVIEEVAYTWFNRLIAVRFMEVNDYLPCRVLSSETKGKNEPDIVTDPSASGIDFSLSDTEHMSKLRDDELFCFLFKKQCSELSKVMPGLFEKENNYMELLLTLSFTDNDSVVRRLVHDIEEEDFKDQVQIVGWLYQYYNTELNNLIYDGNMSKTRIPKELIPAATTIYTPDWPVRYMVENSLGRLWVEGHPNHNCKSEWKYYLDEAEQDAEVQNQLDEIRKEYAVLTPEQILCIDPCCGSGHILCYLFDVLMQIYEDYGYTLRDSVNNIIKKNLWGLDIDDRAGQLAYFAVMMKAVQYDKRFLRRNDIPQPHIYSPKGYEDGKVLGSLLIVDELEPMPEKSEEIFLFDESYENQLNQWNFRRALAQKYHVVVTNPPYLGSSRFNPVLDKYIKENFADEKSDLCMAMYRQALHRLCKPNGFVAFITTSSWMFLSSFEKVRKYIQSSAHISSLVDFGTELFDGKVGHNPIVAWVTRKSNVSYKMTAIRLVDFCYSRRDEKEPEFFNQKNRYIAQPENFEKIPGSPVAYWVSENFVRAFETGVSLGLIGRSSEGIKTGNNDLYLRFWYEVSACSFSFGKDITGKKWVPHHKGGNFRKWYGNLDYAINWGNNGFEIKHSKNSGLQGKDMYFKPILSWSKITSKATSLRYIPPNCLFDSAGPAFYSEKNMYYVLAFVNALGTVILGVINPTVSCQVGDIKSLPLIISNSYKPKIDDLTQENINLSKQDWDSFETSWDFKKHPLV